MSAPEKNGTAAATAKEARCHCGRPIHPAPAHDKEPVCLMHSRDPEKSNDEFQEEIDAILETAAAKPGKAANFEGFVFPSAYYAGRTFSVMCSFAFATFTQLAYFIDARFTQEANFSGATFTEEANFFKATFTQKANFIGATFAKRAKFSGATFTEEANFFKATFTQKAHFTGATFTKHADFSNDRFTEEANFPGARFRGKGDSLNCGVFLQRFGPRSHAGRNNWQLATGD